MLLNTFIYTLVFCISLSFGIYALSLSPKSITHRLFSMTAFCVSFVSIEYIFCNNINDPVLVWEFYKYGIAVYILCFYLLFLFVVNQTGFHLPAGIHLFFSLFCLLSVIISFLMPSIFDLVKDEDVWKIKAYKVSLWLYYQNIYIFIFFTAMNYILIRKLVLTKLNREKRQYLVLILSLSFLYIPVFIFWYIVKYSPSGKLWPVAPMPVLFLCFLAGCLFCIVNYRLFKLTPEFVSSDILANITDSVFLLDQNRRIITANKKVKMFTGYERPEGMEIKNILSVNTRIEHEIEKLVQMMMNDFSCRLNCRTAGGEKILMDVRFSIIKDRWNDILGVLIICKEVKELSQLKQLFRITDREAEMIQFILAGRSNNEMAKELFITENTVKRHITNIYNKFNCNNRMQLAAILKSFNIIPEQESERTVIIS